MQARLVQQRAVAPAGLRAAVKPIPIGKYADGLGLWVDGRPQDQGL